jgi:hypothetical protein
MCRKAQFIIFLIVASPLCVCDNLTNSVEAVNRLARTISIYIYTLRKVCNKYNHRTRTLRQLEQYLYLHR